MLLGTAVLQAAAAPLTAAAGGFTGAGADLPVVPPAPFFAVWSVPVFGGLACAVWGLPLHRATAWPYRQVQVPLSVAQVGFAAWLAAASSSWPWLSLPVFLVMLAALIVAMRGLTGGAAQDSGSAAGAVSGRTTTLARMLLGTTVGVYAGWTTAAVWVNAASLLPQTGLAPSGASSTALQCLAVAGAGAAAAAGARAFQGQLPYVATAAYALIGVSVSASRADLPALLGTAITALTVVAAVTVITRVHPRPGPPPHANA